MIFVIRHGQTDLNKERKMQGSKGLPLNEYGIKQATALREKLQNIDFDFVFSSPQERAVQTAEIVTGKKTITVERLDVFDLGEADTLPITEIKMAGSIIDFTVYKGVEDPNRFVNRVFSFMKELENQKGKKELNILISGHRCTTGCIGAYMDNTFRIFIDNYLDAWQSSSLSWLKKFISREYKAREITDRDIIDFGLEESIQGWEQGFNFAKENNVKWEINEISNIPLRDDETLVIISVTMVLQGRSLNSGHLFFQTFKKDISDDWKLIRSYIEAGIPLDNIKRIKFN